jgi:hypothetical protein
VPEKPKPCVGDVQSRSFFIMRAIIADPEEIAAFCNVTMRLSQLERTRIIARIERQEMVRLFGKPRRSKAAVKRKRAA